MNAEMISNVVDIELINEGIKYSLKVLPSVFKYMGSM
jgi:hypothetical protein